MFSNKRALGVAAGAAALVLLSSPSFADLTKCASLIDKEGAAMVAKVVKNFQTCVDAYHKDLAKPPTPALSKAAAACEKALAAVLASGGLIDKEVSSKLVTSVPATCTESDLLALGHLSNTLFGTNWARLQGSAALQSAYEAALAGSHDFVNALIKVGDTGSCPSCVKLRTPPCNETGARLTNVNSNAIVKVSVLTLTVPLDGTAVLKICDNSTTGLPNIPSGTLYVIGGPAKLLKAAPVGAVAVACTRSISAEGIIFCGGSPQKVSYTACTDHMPSAANKDGATTSGACTGTVCAASTTNVTSTVVDPAEPDGEIIGGGCLTLSSAGGAAGDAFVNLSSQIGLAPPGDNCLNPATYTSFGLPATTALTTGTANAKVLNQDSDGTTPSGDEVDADAVSGSAFNCANLAFGNTSGGVTVGAFSAINTLQPIPGTYLDSTTTFKLTYE